MKVSKLIEVLTKLHREHGDLDIAVLGVSSDEGNGQVKEVLAEGPPGSKPDRILICEDMYD